MSQSQRGRLTTFPTLCQIFRRTQQTMACMISCKGLRPKRSDCGERAGQLVLICSMATIDYVAMNDIPRGMLA